MAYCKKTYKFRNAREVVEYHTGKYGAPGQKRQEKKELTPEQVEKINQYTKERKARHKLWKYFDVNDYFVDLTYQVKNRPADMETAKDHFSKFIRVVRDEYHKRGHEVRWLRNIEVGFKNAWHVHLIIKRIPDTDIILRKAWKHGKVVSQLLYEKDEFQELAAYITKTPKTDDRLKESSYSCSRNMPLPDPETKEYRYWTTWKNIKIPEGFYLDKNSFHEGENPKTGYKYRTYILLRIRRLQNASG